MIAPRVLTALLATAVLLAGCFPAPSYRSASYVTPKDPPPLPQSKPVPPADLAAWSRPQIAGATGTTAPASPPPGIIEVQVQELAPQSRGEAPDRKSTRLNSSH